MGLLAVKLGRNLIVGLLLGLVSLVFLLYLGRDSMTARLKHIPAKTNNSPQEILSHNPQADSLTPSDHLGLDVTNIHEKNIRQLHLASKSGVLIKRVRFNSSAEAAGLQPADIIFGINKTPVMSVDDYQRALQGAQKAGMMKMRIVRQGTELDVSIPLSQAGD